MLHSPLLDISVDQAKLNETPLESLEWEELSFFINRSMTTVGDDDDFKHFLPRILELYVSEYWERLVHIGIFLSKLDYANWELWPEIEYNAVKSLLDDWFLSLKSSNIDNDKEILSDIYDDKELFKFKYQP